MPAIELSKEITGKDITDVIKRAAETNDFNFYDFDGKIFVARQFPEHVPEHKRLSFDTTPSLNFNFGEIDLTRKYRSIQCQTMIGIMRMQPIDLETDSRYKSHYDSFVTSLKSILSS